MDHIKICPLCETLMKDDDIRMVDGKEVCVYCILKIFEWVHRQAEKILGNVLRAEGRLDS